VTTEPAEHVDRVIEGLVYEHLVALIDFDRMIRLEMAVGLQLQEMNEQGKLGATLLPAQLAERAAGIIERAWHRVIDDPRRYVDPRDWQPDDDCALCRRMAEDPEPVRSGSARSPAGSAL
jgi:hypothetical protein